MAIFDGYKVILELSNKANKSIKNLRKNNRTATASKNILGGSGTPPSKIEIFERTEISKITQRL